MFRKFMTTTAIVALMSTGAIAADEGKTDMKTGTEMKSGTEMKAGDNSALFSSDKSVKPMNSWHGYYTGTPNQVLASSLIGQTVYHGAVRDDIEVGDVNDIVMSRDGTAKAVVIGVGGFLGIGEKEVAVDFERLTWTSLDNRQYLTLAATKEELEQAPEFQRTPENEMESSTGDDAAMETTKTDDSAITGNKSDQDVAMTEPTDTTETADKSMTDDQTTADTQEEMAVVDPTTVSADDLIGAVVYSAENENIGEIGDVILTGDEKKAEAYIVDVGGFLGIGEKPVAIEPGAVKVMKDGNGTLSVHTPFEQAKLENHKAYTKDGYDQDRDSVVIR
ncbi:PRC-barrel domain-containing protein [Rhodobium gokarnense]|uniref:Sporulation protein YlmC with PRC-barrel domain n=1 Tax=Rhodobium gokarnense TaxID=364296 RepID=A0ABT3H8C9_9HYPH|nr:PRC-barrel domain-containing protein [Rhodobium gokarnense]MCW2306623.1 sporulation protein YlmC with PRC-barrel domain [Rhodobium gokarnense]